MKGSVINIMLLTLEKEFGKEEIDKAKKKCEFNDKHISLSANIESKKMEELIQCIAVVTSHSDEDIWKILGRKNALSFQKWFPSYFKRKSYKEFLMLTDTVHKKLTKMFQDATPPTLEVKEVDEKTIDITYHSKRSFFSYFEGMLYGCAELFHEEIKIEQIEKTVDEKNQGVLKLRIMFQSKTYENKKYMFSILFSYGFCKTIELKIGMNTFVFSLIGDFILGEPPIYALIHSVITGLILYTLTAIFVKPSKDAIKELERIGNKDLTHDIRITTNDNYEESFRTINHTRINLANDFVIIKGFIDDLNNFSQKFEETSDNLFEKANNIADGTSDVSKGSLQLATDTQEIANTVNENVESLKFMGAENLAKKDNVIMVVEVVRDSFSYLNQIAKELNEIKDTFGEVNRKGEELANSVQDTMEIVKVVEKIAEQTNLLSLNASIEAAKAGEVGKGFSVVANEIRKLVENSKKTANDINEKLSVYKEDVMSLIKGITSQYECLSNGIDQLNSISSKKDFVTDKMNEISDFILDVVLRLDKEINKIANLSVNVESLAAVGQENAAAVVTISDQIEELSRYINILKDYSKELKHIHDIMQYDLDRYQC